MEKNKINGIKPFNDFFFKSCYYHQLLAGIASFGVDKDAVLLNSFTSIQPSFNTGKNGFFNEEKLEKLLGYKRIHCNVSRRKLIRCIDKGQPVIMGVDCYYLDSRPDTYLIQHMPHFVLVYGYDLTNKEANIVDHQYRNGYAYIEKTVSLDNILLANKMFRKGVLNRKLSCYILKKRKTIGSFDIWQYIDEKKINDNREGSLKNINELRRIINYDLDAVRENVEKITNYLNDLKTFYYTLSKVDYFVESQEKQKSIMALVSAYSNVLSLFWKVKAQNNYDYISRHSDNVLRKLTEIEELEKTVYDLLLEVRKKDESIYSDKS